MGTGVSIFLIAIGAILAFAVEVEAEGVDLNTIGVILMVVGIFGLLLSLVFWNSWGGFGYRQAARSVPLAPREPQVVVQRSEPQVIVEREPEVVVERRAPRRTVIQE